MVIDPQLHNPGHEDAAGRQHAEDVRRGLKEQREHLEARSAPRGLGWLFRLTRTLFGFP